MAFLTPEALFLGENSEQIIETGAISIRRFEILCAKWHVGAGNYTGHSDF
jgi:hypothetical protein